MSQFRFYSQGNLVNSRELASKTDCNDIPRACGAEEEIIPRTVYHKFCISTFQEKLAQPPWNGQNAGQLARSRAQT